jgi:hexosaminidase
MKLNYSQCNDDIKVLMNEVKEILEISFDKDGINLVAKQSNEKGFLIENSNHEIRIQYHQKTDFCRALLTIGSSIQNKPFLCHDDFEKLLIEKSSFEEFGVMLDFSRNAVMRVEPIKQYIRILALMGYQFLGLYMEDTIEVKEEPYLGHMRGAMTAAELKEIDQYASIFDIEIRAYIQTLAHLNQITRYEEYQEMIDTDDILLVGEERTYQFLENLIRTVSENISSRKINIGMDEAHMVGLGKYLERHGATNRFDIMKSHLDRVIEICRTHGLQIQMWSDMFFRLMYGGEYYVEKESIMDFPEIPSDVELIYWDYYSCEEEHYDKMLKRHSQITDRVGFAGGAWKWTGFTPHNGYSLEIGKAAMKACKKNNVKSVVITAWGDNGAEASNFSILPALYADAEYNYRGSIETSKFLHITGMSFEDFMLIDLPNCFSEDSTVHNNSSKYLLYNDVFLGTFDSIIFEEIAACYKEASLQLKKCSTNIEFGYMFDTQSKLCTVLHHKAGLGIRIKSAYDRKDMEQLSLITKEEIPQIIEDLVCFYQAFETQWEKENKPFGFEVQCIRIGGLQNRLEYAKKQLNAYISGKKEKIDELEATRKPFRYFVEEDINKLNYNLWRDIVSPSVVG